MTRTRTPFILLVAVAALVATAPAPASAARKVRFGAWTPGSPFGGQISTVKALQRRIQRRVQIVSWFQDWDVDERHFQYNVTRAVRAIRRSRRVPMLTWEPYRPGPWETYSNQAIANGAHDAYIRAWARGVARLKGKVYVRFAHEFNGNWYPWGGPVNGNSPSQFAAMWRHVVDVARSEGARNIRWVWSALNEDVPNEGANHFENYYPGRDYVDVMGLSGFNWGAGTPQFGGWRSFRKIFRRPYRRLARLGPQPIWITEVGSASDGGSKYRWVRDMFRSARRWKRLKAIVWYDQDKERDWSTASAATAFRNR